MAFKMNTEDKSAAGKRVKPGERLYLTADRKALVQEGDTRAAFLYCTEHQEVMASEYEKLKKPRAKISRAKTEDKGNS